MNKRIKIEFKEIMKGKYKIIPPEEIAESKKRIRKEMRRFIRKLKNKK